MTPSIFYHPRMLSYSFGPSHPFKPERLSRAMNVLASVMEIDVVDPGPGDPDDPLRVHEPAYVDAVRSGNPGGRYGFGPGDNPPFPGMFEATLAYGAGTLAAARAVRDGSQLGCTLGGGLHHARRSEASGFCIFNDPACAISVLKERFERVAYVDIDLHHGDGVQWLWYDDPNVLKCSIHQDGRTLYPGTGFVTETGASCSSINVPLEPGTTGDTWLWAFEHAILPALHCFKPGAVVLEMGADPHFSDPLGHLMVSAQEWWHAIATVRDLGLPLVACGGGGYNMDAVVRMWAGAVLTLWGQEIPPLVPGDRELPTPRGAGREQAERVVAYLEANVLPGCKR
ncbi:MAG: hypothetical protein K1X67_19740 [Fimbriimonadaceae bacterium]|nr:hypothetical protein [Fimbriimonadaceae bacterium]